MKSILEFFLMKKICCFFIVFLLFCVIFMESSKTNSQYDLFAPIGKKPDIIYERYNELIAESYFSTMNIIVENINNFDVIREIFKNAFFEIDHYYNDVYLYDSDINTMVCSSMGVLLRSLKSKLSNEEYNILLNEVSRDDSFLKFIKSLENIGPVLKKVDNFTHSPYASYCWNLGVLEMYNYIYFYKKCNYDINVTDFLRKRMAFVMFLYYLAIKAKKIEKNLNFENSMFNAISYFLKNGDSYFLKPLDNPMGILKSNKRNGAIMRILVPDVYANMNYDEYMHEVYMFKNWLMSGIGKLN